MIQRRQPFPVLFYFITFLILIKMNVLIRYWKRYFWLFQCQTFLLDSRMEKKLHVFRNKGFWQCYCIYSTSVRYSLKGHLKVRWLFNSGPQNQIVAAVRDIGGESTGGKKANFHKYLKCRKALVRYTAKTYAGKTRGQKSCDTVPFNKLIFPQTIR